ncbi:MAG: agmatinase family protein [Candidatus Eisenbacteria bacterium]|uniref:Agmatinase family protein n=1 Tax=Eiseniibacteriota bacterium TaxID=2212470 RepID=A0A538U9R4_UNCEI|nr:MAG: agmatinase family protein [Candidatus Eisenbacteria bacterium]
MTSPTWPSGLPENFGGLDEEFAALDRARAVILPAPYDFSTSYQGGARLGPRAILAASRNMELWDDEVGAVYRHGIHTLPELEPTAEGPHAMAARVEQAIEWILRQKKLPVLLGGEHSLTAGAVRAAARHVEGLSVLQMMRRVRELVPAASVGIRSLSEEEAEYLEAHPAPMWSTREFRALGGRWDPILQALTDRVYVTIDVDGLDPSQVPATGTPEPGGLDWYELVDMLRAVAQHTRIVGFDVVELAPLPGQVASDFLAARLVYRTIGLCFGSSRASSAARTLESRA